MKVSLGITHCDGEHQQMLSTCNALRASNSSVNSGNDDVTITTDWDAVTPLGQSSCDSLLSFQAFSKSVANAAVRDDYGI